jgi:hypothetical protein
MKVMLLGCRHIMTDLKQLCTYPFHSSSSQVLALSYHVQMALDHHTESKAMFFSYVSNFLPLLQPANQCSHDSRLKNLKKVM